MESPAEYVSIFNFIVLHFPCVKGNMWGNLVLFSLACNYSDQETNFLFDNKQVVVQVTGVALFAGLMLESFI